MAVHTHAAAAAAVERIARGEAAVLPAPPLVTHATAADALAVLQAAVQAGTVLAEKPIPPTRALASAVEASPSRARAERVASLLLALLPFPTRLAQASLAAAHAMHAAVASRRRAILSLPAVVALAVRSAS